VVLPDQEEKVDQEVKAELLDHLEKVVNPDLQVQEEKLAQQDPLVLQVHGENLVHLQEEENGAKLDHLVQLDLLDRVDLLAQQDLVENVVLLESAESLAPPEREENLELQDQMDDQDQLDQLDLQDLEERQENRDLLVHPVA
jgi:spore cortex formation protein SpoVR/YcgB (stage V sporulation)